MATIKTSLMLVDKMSAPLKSINKAMNIVLNSMESVARASGTMIDNRAIQQAREEMARANTELQNISQSAHTVESSTNSATSSFKRLATAVGTVFSVQKTLELSDTMTQIQSRLKLMTGDSEKAKDVWNDIYAAANRSRSSFASTASLVTKLGINAKGAFNNTDELISFAEAVNKTFVISGASAQEQSAAFLQLSQAMASGVLRGEELNSIFEQSPMLIQVIADYLNVPLGQIRSMAAEGKISADIVKNAVLSASREIDAEFQNMQYTWSQLWATMSNVVLKVIQPILNAIGSIASFLSETWTIIAPILTGIAVSIGILELMTINWAAAIGACSTAFAWLNAVIAMNPFIKVIMAVAVLIALLNGVVKGYNKVENESVSAAGVVAGAIYVVIAAFKNAGMVIGNIIMGIVAGVLALGTNIGIAFGNAIAGVKAKFWSLLADATMIIAMIANQLNKLPFVNIDVGGLVGKAGEFANNAQAAFDSKQNYVDVEAAVNRGLSTFDAFGDGWAQEAYKTGYEWGAGVFGGAGGTNYSEEISENTASIAESAGSAAASLDKSSEDLKYLRDIAEQEAINRFTTAEVKIDMTGMTNRIDSSMDIDGIIRTLADGFVEAMSVTAEGVH